ncbi:hypothetical protein [Lelliottia amnigena]|uniref:hypothetical protein n=1 Tax=Lelliottia amnigena TaxID=61646 RepID=UPI001C239A7B|nr:hypothetical protein [Lelliottia amnigena]QXB19825.1 hypothetical protein I6L76_11160 [Lelliottia amnigena]
MTMNLLERIEKALNDFTSGRASMHVPPIDTDVDMVLADCQAQLTALTSQLESVVAENAALKAVESNLVRNIINDLGDTEFQYEKVQTPATAAFLAEVRASGIDQWITSRDGRWNGTTKEAERFAAQLRQEAAQ